MIEYEIIVKVIKMSEEYSLSGEERNRVLQLVPSSQTNAFMVFKVDFRIGRKRLKHGICVLTEHLILVVRRSFMSGVFTTYKQYHIISISKIKIRDKEKASIYFSDTRLTLISPGVQKFIQILSQNYLLCTSNMPSATKATVTLPDGYDLPSIRPNLSISQKFQFVYNSFCSLSETPYNHDVVRFFHDIISSGNIFVDYNELPLHEIDISYGNPVALPPAIQAMMYVPFVFGQIIRDVNRPDFLKIVAPIIARSSSIKLLQCSNCNIHEGIHELAQAMHANPKLSIVFYDLSNNHLQNMSQLAIEFAQIKRPLLYLNLSDTDMDYQTSAMFMQAIAANDYLHELRYILFKHCKTNEETVTYFIEYLKDMFDQEPKQKVLRSLDIGCLTNGAREFFTALTDFPQPLEILHLEGSKIGKKDMPALLGFLKSTEFLHEINLSGTNLSLDNLTSIISAIEENEKLSGFNILLDNLNLGKNFAKFVKIFNTSRLLKWNGMSLERNDITTTEFLDAATWFDNLTNLRHFNFGGNFHKNNPKLEEAIEMIFAKQTLFHVGLAGTSRRHIGAAGAEFVAKQMENNFNITELDISCNNIHDAGIVTISKMLVDNMSILDFVIDGQKPKSLDCYTKLYEVIASHVSINSCPWPKDDVASIIDSLKPPQKIRATKSLIKQYMLAGQKMQQNRAGRGLHSHISNLSITEVDEMIDSLTIKMHQGMYNMRIRTHSNISELYNLPYPHEASKSSKHRKLVDRVDEDAEPPPIKLIEEQENIDQNSTLQFNSLCLRRPGCEELRRPISGSGNLGSHPGHNVDSNKSDKPKSGKRDKKNISSFEFNETEMKSALERQKAEDSKDPPRSGNRERNAEMFFSHYSKKKPNEKDEYEADDNYYDEEEEIIQGDD